MTWTVTSRVYPDPPPILRWLQTDSFLRNRFRSRSWTTRERKGGDKKERGREGGWKREENGERKRKGSVKTV